jgi:hypothetical protein
MSTFKKNSEKVNTIKKIEQNMSIESEVGQQEIQVIDLPQEIQEQQVHLV